MSFRVINGKTYMVGQFENTVPKAGDTNSVSTGQTSSFKDILASKLNKESSFKISNHANERMKDMNLSELDFKKLNEGINTAEEKGSKNSLIMYKDIAFITSIENRTVITAVDKDRAKENIYTNIDSVLFL
jgi:flagellar operon protein